MLKTQHSFSSFINSIAASVFYVLHTFKNALGGRGMPLWTPYLTYTFVSTPYKSLKQSFSGVVFFLKTGHKNRTV